MSILYLFIALGASVIGAISGIGGGVIIKPVMDCLGTLDVSAVSFLSGCTVLTMSFISVLRNVKNGISIDKKISTLLALGACIGGIAGKSIFDLLKTILGNLNVVGMVQAIILLLINIGVFFYIRYQSKIHTLAVKNAAACIIIGLTLGILSSFLGIGGGPINIAVLYYFFSMKPKQAAVNSLFIILCSQIASLANTMLSHTVPTFPLAALAFMCIGGVGGALIGSSVSKKISEKTVQKIFMCVLLLLILINIYNIILFARA